ncbi:MAG TPA: class II aldolase/adducin family protein [Bacillota bacterium]|nr:class II aldolase/adducin family protein [Bacillota bacterium]
MRFAFDGCEGGSPWLQAVCMGLTKTFTARGHTLAAQPDDGCGIVFHAVSEERPRPFPRKSRATFVVGLTELPEPESSPLHRGYPLLVRSISNMLLLAGAPSAERPLADAHLLTPELGCYPAATDSARPFEDLYERLTPLATSHLVIDNVFDPDLPQDLWEGTDATDDLVWASRQLAAMRLLPTPFPVQEVLGPDDMRFLHRLYGIGGLSYGNISVRHDESRFWMSASGVDKGKLGRVGDDILLVKGYDPDRDAMLLSVRPDVEPHRVSVDAIEHLLIYQEHPDIGAILHVHAWVDGIRTTDINYPCGTMEIGLAVAAALRAEPDPAHATIGLRNHGITAVGPNLHEIFARLADQVQATVPMR